MVDIGLALSYIVCKAHMHVTHAKRGESGAYPQEILKSTLTEIESLGIFSDLLPLVFQ